MTSPIVPMKDVGRDIFAPAAAELAAGRPFEETGESLGRLQSLSLPPVRRTAHGGIEGRIVHVDRFGNLITNIARDQVGEMHEANPVRVTAGRHSFTGIRSCYADVEPGESLVLWGSFRFLEIAVNGDSAAKALHLSEGETVRVFPID